MVSTTTDERSGGGSCELYTAYWGSVRGYLSNPIQTANTASATVHMKQTENDVTNISE